MSLLAPNKKVFSYNNTDNRNSNFTYKNFAKTSSYHTNFSGNNFTAVSFRSAAFKFCSFYDAKFKQTEFIGTNLKSCNFTNAKFSDSIFNGVNLMGCNFKNASFKNTYFVGTGVKQAKNFPVDSDGIIWLDKMPAITDFSNELVSATESLRTNDYIRRSGVLHLKRERINTLTLLILTKEFTNEELIKAFSILPKHINSQFYTVAYLKKLLLKLKASTLN